MVWNHYYGWTASIKQRLILSTCRLCLLRDFPFLSWKWLYVDKICILLCHKCLILEIVRLLISLFCLFTKEWDGKIYWSWIWHLGMFCYVFFNMKKLKSRAIAMLHLTLNSITIALNNNTNVSMLRNAESRAVLQFLQTPSLLVFSFSDNAHTSTMLLMC